ncbi:hypothetical protein TanjilG_00484 [Lupinus angustifolius]|uniref:Kazal-like domain-containing protein n=1 Tax=Lupinus angustifolius TaxID=3871 RepID=A0A4P1QXW6_LUPAN|nr:PREDICTED: uncharacterized protein LOC109327918 [Lupinus angustifolius]OIV96902.1 hypothetical protein TanjilG_00484 [Lupinus angustifolius]
MNGISISPCIVPITVFFFFFLSVFQLVLAGEEPIPPVTVLPSQSAGERQNLCVGAVWPTSCPVKCFRADPVCGANGVTYWCGCVEAACEGAKVAKVGFCEVGNGGSAPFSGQALLLVHILWHIVLGLSVIFGLL